MITAVNAEGTFGKTITAGGYENEAGSTMSGSLFQFIGGNDQRLWSITAYCDSPGNLQYGIYDNSGNLLGVTYIYTSAVSEKQWKTLNINAPGGIVLVNASYYYLMAINMTHNWWTDDGGFAVYYKTNTYTFPSTMTWSTASNKCMSIYGNYSSNIIDNITTNILSKNIQDIIDTLAFNIFSETPRIGIDHFHFLIFSGANNQIDNIITFVKCGALLDTIVTYLKNTYYSFYETLQSYISVGQKNIIATTTTFINIILQPIDSISLMIKQVIWQISEIKTLIVASGTMGDDDIVHYAMGILPVMLIMLIPTLIVREVLSEIATIPMFCMMGIVCFLGGILPLWIAILIIFEVVIIYLGEAPDNVSIGR